MIEINPLKDRQPTCISVLLPFGGIFDYDQKSARLREVKKHLETPSFEKP